MARALAILSLLTLGLCFGTPQGAAAASAAKPATAAGKTAAKAGKSAKSIKPKARVARKAAPAKQKAARAGNRPHAKSAARSGSKTATQRRAAARPRALSTAHKARTTAAHGRASTARRSGGAAQRVAAAPHRKPPLRTLIADHAEHYDVPEHLVRRVISKESQFNPNAKNGPNIGLMQIQLGTARGMGYRGDAKGLLDPDTNLRYGVAYLANAFRVAHGDEDDAMRLYQSGYYNEAKRKGLTRQLIAAR